MPEWFAWLFLFVLACLAVSIAVRFVLHFRRGVVFPKLDRKDFIFRERFASGRLHGTSLFRGAWASNCLQVVVTELEVWIRMPFPFSLFGKEFRLEHRIPRQTITAVERGGDRKPQVLYLDWRDENGEHRRFELVLRSPEEFLQAINAGTRAGLTSV